MNKFIGRLLLAAGLLMSSLAFSQSSKPTIVLVHGAFADSFSWNGVATLLQKDGYHVVAAANPLRTVKSDAQYVADVVSSIQSPVVLVGHSYGGFVITEAASASKVRALVYVAGFAPEVGESAAQLSGKFPGGTLGAALAQPIPLAGGGKDLYIQSEKFHQQFAADLPLGEAQLMAVTQCPVTEAALNDAATRAAWKNIPSWFVYGEKDKNIPAQAQAFMAERAKSRQTVVVKGASHVVMVSHPDAVAKLIESAARAVSAGSQD